MGVTVLVNFTIAKINKGNASYLPKLFELNKFRDHNGLFLKEAYISAHTFTNVAINTAACREFAWANYFLKKYATAIHEDLRKDALNLSCAFIHFYQQSYDDVLRSLVTISDNSLYTAIRVRSLYIRAYYELSLTEVPYTEITINEINNLKTFLRKNEVREDRKEAYLNFCKICMDIINLKSKKSIRQMMEKSEELWRFK